MEKRNVVGTQSPGFEKQAQRPEFDAVGEAAAAGSREIKPCKQKPPTGSVVASR